MLMRFPIFAFLALQFVASSTRAENNPSVLRIRRAVERFEAMPARERPEELIAFVSSTEQMLRVAKIVDVEKALKELGWGVDARDGTRTFEKPFGEGARMGLEVSKSDPRLNWIWQGVEIEKGFSMAQIAKRVRATKFGTIFGDIVASLPEPTVIGKATITVGIQYCTQMGTGASYFRWVLRIEKNDSISIATAEISAVCGMLPFEAGLSGARPPKKLPIADYPLDFGSGEKVTRDPRFIQAILGTW